MDPVVLAGMIFSIVVLLLIGGFVLLLPLTRQLGEYLRYRMVQGDRRQRDTELEALRAAVESLRRDVEELAERQDFTELLLEPPHDEGEPS